ncbi:MAG: DNA primase large subunit [archaeon]|nr:DNA primase large subunit [archaeon]
MEIDSMGNVPPTYYDEVPEMTLDIEKLQVLVKQRYDMLRIVEDCYNKKTIMSNSYCKLLDEFTWKAKGTTNNDIASHFLLAVAYCKYDSEKNWFCTQEAKLYRERVVRDGYDIKDVLEILGITFEEYKPEQENDEILQEIFSCQDDESPSSTPQRKNATETIFFVPFELAVSLVPSHNYYMRNGNIYIPKSDLVNLFEVVLTEHFQQNLRLIYNHYDELMSDGRIKHIITTFESEREAESFKKDNDRDNISNEDKLNTIKDVDYYSSRTFPLCMYLIQHHINENSHLMHFGRLQYTLFLKGCGLPLDECLNFFRKKYEKKTPADKFEKQYAYNIRHSYGQEGKRTDYPPYSCRKIQGLNNPSSQECHGCPFKTYSDEKLRNLITHMGLGEVEIATIMDKKRTNEFPLACVKYFEAKFPGANYEKVGVHPNHYFISAMKALRKKVNIQYEKNGSSQK